MVITVVKKGQFLCGYYGLLKRGSFGWLLVWLKRGQFLGGYYGG